MSITTIDTGSVFTDSVVVEFPAFNYTLKTGTTRRWEISDTTWTNVQDMINASGTQVDTLVNNNGNTSYRVFVGDYEGVRIRWTNVEAVPSRAFWYKAQAVEK